MTEQKQQHVPSAIDKTELTYWLEEAGKLNSSDYTKDGWDIFRQIVTEATGVKDDATATEHEVSEAVIALIDGMIALEKEKVYTVTVDGKKVAEGVYNQIVTITADAPQVGQKFAGWQLKDKIVSYDEVYTFAISGNMAFTATYAPQEQTIEKPLYAAVANTMIIKRADGKANVKYIAKLSIPDNYILNETGLLWYGKPDLENLCTETGPTPGTKKIVAPVISSTYQFAVNVNGIPAGKTIRGVIYAKVTDKETQQTKWVYSEEVRLTNKSPSVPEYAEICKFRAIFISPAACTTVPPPNDTQEINIAADNAADKNFFNLITLLLFSILSVIKIFILFGLHKSLLKSPSSFLIIFTFLCKLYRTIHIYA